MTPEDERSRGSTPRPATYTPTRRQGSTGQRIEYTADREDRPVWTDDDFAVATELAYCDGYARALELAADRVDELDAVWRPVPRRSWEQQLAARVRLFEHCAHQLAERMGRPAGYVYRGGPTVTADWPGPVDEQQAVAA